MRGRVILVAAVIVVAGLLIGGRAWVRGQDYVTHGSTSRVPVQARIVEDEDAAPDEPQEIAVVSYRDGARVVYGLSLRNDGPLSVEVKRVARLEPEDESFFLFRPVEVRMGEQSEPGTDAPVAFRPFSLGPDEERYLEVAGVLEAPGRAAGDDRDPLRPAHPVPALSHSEQSRRSPNSAEPVASPGPSTRRRTQRRPEKARPPG